MANLRDAAAHDRTDAAQRALVEQQARAAQQAAEPAGERPDRGRSVGDDADPT